VIPSIPQKERIVSLDIIRGIALFGILLVNIKGYIVYTEEFPSFYGINHWLEMLFDVLIEKKFFSIFSFLFGVGFYIFASRAEQRGDRPLWRFTRRLIAMLLIGIVHLFFFFGSILPVYAVAGLVLLPFYRARVVTIVRWLIGLVIVYEMGAIAGLLLQLNDIPGQLALFCQYLNSLSNDLLLIIIMFMAGFAAAKSGMIQHMDRYRHRLGRISLGALLLFLPLAAGSFYTAIVYGYELEQNMLRLETIPGTVFYLASLFWIMNSPRMQQMFQPVARVGQMALTNYFTQNLIGNAMIALMGMTIISPLASIGMALVIYGIQMVGTLIWFRYFTMGPMEKLWRWMTYGRQLPVKSQG